MAPEGWSLSYVELDRASDEVAAGLGREDVASGDVVALLFPSSPDYLVAYAAVAKVGANTAGINPRLTPPERDAAMEAIGPDLFLAERGLAAGLRTSARSITVDLAGSPSAILRDLRTDGRVPDLPADPSRPVAIVLTSGTTGTPRGAVFTERQLESIARMDGALEWGGGGPMLASTELVHIGFMTKLPWYLRTGMRIHLLRPWRAADALRVISEQGIAIVGAISSQIALMLREPAFDRYDLSAVETLVVGGGPSPPAMIDEARKRFWASYSVRYSSTESGGIGTMTDPDGPEDVGEVGEVWLRSPAVMDGYWRDPEATAAALRDGWLRTGDLGAFDDHGCLRLAGRRSEMYVRGGYNVYPMEVEAALGACPDVAGVAVVPRTDPVMGEIGVAFVVPSNPDRPPSLEDLRRFAACRLARYKLPEDLRLLDELPLTSIHKVDRTALRRRLATHPDPAATRTA